MASETRPMLIDTKAYGKLRTFSGKEDDWATWRLVARSYLALLSTEYQDYLSRAEGAELGQLALSQQGDQARSHSWTLFNVLVQSVEGRALWPGEPWWTPTSQGSEDAGLQCYGHHRTTMVIGD